MNQMVTPIANRESTPGWIETDDDNGTYDLGLGGQGPGPWVNITGLSITVPFDTSPGDRLDAYVELHAVGKIPAMAGDIEIGFGLNGSPPFSGTRATVESNFDGIVPVSVSTEIVTLIAGDVINVFARDAVDGNPAFGVDIDATTGSTHKLVVVKDVQELTGFQLSQVAIVGTSL